MRNHLSATGDAARLRDGSSEGWLLFLFSLQSAICLAVITWFELRHNTGDGWIETALAVMQSMEAVVVVVGAWTFTVMEGTMILAERYRKRRLEEGIQIGKAEGRMEGRAEGIAEGKAEGREEAMTEWAAWFRRRLQAEAEGRPFDEPPPSPIGEPSDRNGPSIG